MIIRKKNTFVDTETVQICLLHYALFHLCRFFEKQSTHKNIFFHKRLLTVFDRLAIYLVVVNV